MATKKPFMLLEGTPLEKKVYLENPQQPTQEDLKLIQRIYGLPQNLDLKGTVDALNQLSQLSEKPSISQPLPTVNPAQAAINQAQNIAEVENRMKLNDDPLKYLYNATKEKLDIPTGPLSDIPYLGAVIPDEIKIGSMLPKDLVSKEVFEAVGGIGGLYGAKLLEGAPVAFENSMKKKFPMLSLVGSKEAKMPTKGFTGTTAKYIGAETLGAQAGASTYDFLNEMTRYFLDLPETELKDQANQFLYDSYMNLAFTGGSAALAPVFNIFKKPIQKIFGVDPNTNTFKKMKELAETYGYPLGIVQATNSGFWKGYAKVVGVFPWVGTPFRKSGEAIDEATRQYFKRTNNLMPVNTISQLGADVRKMAEGKYDAIRAAQNYLYDDFEEFALKLGNKKVISLGNTIKQADRTYKKFLESRPKQGYGNLRWPGSRTQEAFGEFYQNLSNLGETATLQEAITLRQMFNDFMVNFKSEFGGTIPRSEGNAIGKLQNMFERDFSNMMKLDSEIDDAILDQVKKKYNTAVEFFADTTKNYEGGIITDFKQMNRSMFGPGAEQKGYMYAGEAFNTIFNRAKKDPEAMNHLLSLIQPTNAELKAWKLAGNKDGVTKKVKQLVKEIDPTDPEGVREIYISKEVPTVSRGPDSGRLVIAQRMFNDAIKNSIGGLPSGSNFVDFLSVPSASLEQIQKKGIRKVAPDLLEYQNVTINAGQFAKNLGLDSPDGIEVLNTLFKGTNINVKDIKNFLSAADAAGSFVIPDPSTFVQRRVTLSGFKGMFIGGMAGAGGATALVNFPMLIVPLLLRHGSDLLTDPKALEAITDTLETGVVTAARRKSLLQWAEKFLPNDEEAMRQDQQEQIDDAIFNLQVNPSKDVEQSQAIPEAYDKVRNPYRGMSEQEQIINQKLLDLQQNELGASLTPRFDDQQMNLASAGRIQNPRVRQALAFGNIDQALAERTGGISAI
jgi:hypothetical protein